MKLLTIGIDGGDERIIQSDADAIFAKPSRAKSVRPKIRGDLYSRGWAEIFTGAHCLENGGLLYAPQT